MRPPYLPIKNPTSEVARGIEDANVADRDGDGAETLPLTEGILVRLKDLEDTQLRLIRFSFYFGLKPSEVDELKDSKRDKVWAISTDPKGTPILKFYQSKLVKVARER